MAGAHGASDERLKCEKCHGFVAVVVSDDQTTLRCGNCGYVRDVTDDQAKPKAPEAKADAKPEPADAKPTEPADTKAADAKPVDTKLTDTAKPAEDKPVDTKQEAKWTVIGPDGKVMTFQSPEDAAKSLHPNEVPVSEIKAAIAKTDAPKKPDHKPTAAELLGVTPALPKLRLAEDSDPNAGELVAKAKAELAKASVAKPEANVKPVRNVSELDSSSLMDDNSDDEPSPLSLRDAIVDEDDLEEDNGELVSLKDMVVVPPIPVDGKDHPVDSTPHPPARGALRTLPPTAPSLAPTITVEDSPQSVRGEKAKAKSERPPATKDTREPKKARPAPARAQVEEPKKSSWVIPSLAVIAATIVIWRIMIASPGPEANTPPATPTAPASTEPVNTTTPPATETASSAPPNVPSAEPSATAASPAPSTKPVATTPSTTEKKPPPSSSASALPTTSVATATKPTAEGLSMSELLDKAGAARRSGDYATAREFYQKVLAQNPANVEANGGLGDVFRAQGDLASAKTSYERALAASPSYGPAQLGLADTEWDLGNRSGAQRRYAQILERLGERAPARVKQRAASE